MLPCLLLNNRIDKFSISESREPHKCQIGITKIWMPAILDIYQSGTKRRTSASLKNKILTKKSLQIFFKIIFQAALLYLNK